MLDTTTKRRIDTARDILVGKVPDPKSQVEQITIALIYKFMDDMDARSEELGGKREFFSGEYAKYGWKKLMSKELSGFEVLNLYAEAIQKMNINPNIPQLFRDIFKNAFLPYRDPETLKSFLKIIDDFEYDHSERLGDAFEYLLSVLGSQGDAGQFRTPRHIIDFMVEVTDPKKDEKIIDPACGTAGFLISSYKHIVKHNSNNYNPQKDKEAFDIKDVDLDELTANGNVHYDGAKLTPDDRTRLSKNIIGYDISPDMVRLSLVNLYLHGFTEPKITEYDTLTSEDNWNEFADIFLANPPFMSPKGGIKPHKRFSVQSKRSEVLFVDYIVEHLTTNGRAAVIVPEGIIFQSGTAYKQLRKMLVENYLYAVVSLPAGVFNPYSGVKTSILLMDKNLNKKTDNILFVKIENDGFGLGARRIAKDGSQLPEAVKLIKDYKNFSLSNDVIVSGVEASLKEKHAESSLWNIATTDQIAENDEWNLSGERYNSTSFSYSGTFTQIELKEIIKIQSGYAFESKLFNEVKGFPIIRIRNIKTNSTKTKYTGELKREFIIRNGDLIIGMDGEFNCVIWQGGDALLNQRVCRLNEYKDCLKEYVYFMIQKKLKEIEEKTYAVTVKHISTKQINKIQIPLPPLEIQKEIVEEIEGYQKIIDGARQVVENYKPHIDIDPSWEMVELKKIAKNLDGQRVPITKSKRKSGKYPYYGASGIVDFVESYLFDEDLLLVSEDGANLLSRVTPIAFSVSNKIWVNNHAHVLQFENMETQKFIEFYLNSIDLSNYITGSAQPKLNQKALNSIKIPLPEFEIQKDVVNKITLELNAIESNKFLIQSFEQKIKDRIAKVWGE
ncbi:MAG: N-6 DNA methylase [Melioribacteraceae bacterium]